MNNRSIFILLTALLLCSTTYIEAQTKKSKTIYYDDGSVFVGNVISENDQQILLLATTGDTLHIDKNLIRGNRKKVRRPKFHYEKGPWAALNIGISPDFQSDLLVGYRLNAKYSFALGTGIRDIYSEANGIWNNSVFVPIYAYGRRYFGLEKNARPFVGLVAGYSFPVNSGFSFNNHEFEGGATFEPGVGISFAARGKSRFVMSIGQNFQYSTGSNTETDILFNPIEIEYKRWYSRTVFKIGVEFR